MNIVDLVAMHKLEVWSVLTLILVVGVGIDAFGHKGKHEMGFKESVAWFFAWVAIAIVYYFYIDFRFGTSFANLYISGYAMEKALSVDNMVTMIAIFSCFGITSGALKHKILLAGIWGALIFRGIFVAIGTELFNLHWTIQVIFGLIVGWSALAIFKGDDDEDTDYKTHWCIKYLNRWLPVAKENDGTKFVTLIKGAHYVTPAFVVMFVIEFSDVMFSFDSIPAVIGVTKEPILVYSAMILAILGLRSLFFVLNSAMKFLCHLETAVGFVLIFIALKLVSKAVELGGYIPHTVQPYIDWANDPTNSVCVVLGVLVLGIIASLLFPTKEEVNA